MVKQLTSNLLV